MLPCFAPRPNEAHDAPTLRLPRQGSSVRILRPQHCGLQSLQSQHGVLVPRPKRFKVKYSTLDETRKYA